MLNVLIKSSSRYPIRRKAIKQTIQQTLDSLQLFGNFEVEVEIIGDRLMKQMKKKHLGIDETTDVLSFPLEEKVTRTQEQKSTRTQEHENIENTKAQKTQNNQPFNHLTIEQLNHSLSSVSRLKSQVPEFQYPDHITRLGTLLVSYPQAQRQANLHKLTTDKEINQLVEHGMLHLVGIHHE